MSGSEDVQGFGSAAWLRNLGVGAGAALALGGVILGIVPGLLGAPRLLFWLRLPRVHVWAALLLPAIGAIALYRAQEPLTEWVDEWWPLIRRLLDVRWIFGGIERIARLVGAAVWTGTRVIEGAGYTAWVLLFCLVALLFLRTR